MRYCSANCASRGAQCRECINQDKTHGAATALPARRKAIADRLRALLATDPREWTGAELGGADRIIAWVTDGTLILDDLLSPPTKTREVSEELIKELRDWIWYTRNQRDAGGNGAIVDILNKLERRLAGEP